MNNTTKINIGDKVRVINRSEMLRSSRQERFHDFEGTIVSIYTNIFGNSGEVKTDDGTRVFDTQVHQLEALESKA